MAISKKLREQVKLKYNGLCAYTGMPLDDKWQVDHIIPKCSYWWMQPRCNDVPDNINNLLPAIRIINHYKRSLDLEGFRTYMLDFHIRLGKLPKKTSIDKTAKRIEYMNKVAEHFGISPVKPFNGIFYFENITK